MKVDAATRTTISIPAVGPCVIHPGKPNSEGYGRITRDRKRLKAHRVAWVDAYGKIPGRLYVLHRCDIRNCVNPRHLFLGTHADNQADKIAKARHRWAPPAPGEANPNAKLTTAKVRAMRRARAAGVPVTVLAAKYRVSPGHAYDLISGRKWRTV